MSLAAGTKLEPYEIGAQLGAGRSRFCGREREDMCASP